MNNTLYGFRNDTSQFVRWDTSGVQNTANGVSALYSNTTGNYNTADGNQALYANINGTFNVANGYSALQLNTNGVDNTAKFIEVVYDLERKTSDAWAQQS